MEPVFKLSVTLGMLGMAFQAEGTEALVVQQFDKCVALVKEAMTRGEQNVLALATSRASQIGQ